MEKPKETPETPSFISPKIALDTLEAAQQEAKMVTDIKGPVRRDVALALGRRIGQAVGLHNANAASNKKRHSYNYISDVSKHWNKKIGDG